MKRQFIVTVIEKTVTELTVRAEDDREAQTIVESMTQAEINEDIEGGEILRELLTDGGHWGVEAVRPG